MPHLHPDEANIQTASLIVCPPEDLCQKDSRTTKLAVIRLQDGGRECLFESDFVVPMTTTTTIRLQVEQRRARAADVPLRVEHAQLPAQCAC